MMREYPTRPIVAVGVVIQEGHRIVLVRRGREPGKGLWTFPGGAIELGETAEEAVRREALEETGLEVRVAGVMAVVDSLERDERGQIRYHYVIVDYAAHPTGGSLRAGSDASDARWVGLADLEGLALTAKAGQLARELLDRRRDAARSGPLPT
jgi:8-oxo-dGTP diphosphatase